MEPRAGFREVLSLYKGLFIVVFPVPGHVKDMHGIETVLTLEAAGEGFALHSGGHCVYCSYT